MTTKSERINKILVISRIVARHYGYEIGDINNKTQKHSILRVRQFAHYFCCEKKVASLELIGRIIGGKDHTTVMNSRKIIQNLIDTESEWNLSYSILNNQIDLKLKDYLKMEVVKKYKSAIGLRQKRSASIRHNMQYTLVNLLEY